MFGIGRKRRELERALSDAVALLKSIRRMCLQIDDVDDDLFRGDPYLLGYATGALSFPLSPYWNRSFTTFQKGRIVNQAWEANGTSARWAAENVDFLIKSQHEMFFKGMDEASTAMLVQCSKLSANLHDEDVKTAFQDAPAIHRSASSFEPGSTLSLNEAAAMALHHLYLKRHLKRFSPD